MKKLVLLLASVFAGLFAAHAADIYYYQDEFSEQIELFKAGFDTGEEFDNCIISLAKLEKGLSGETAISKKEPLLSEIRALFAFIGEISPESKTYYLSLTQKQTAMQLLGITESEHSSPFCLPIKGISLWDSTYSCYMIDNTSDSMIINYRVEYAIKKTYSSSSGFMDAGISKQTSQAIYSDFGNIKSIDFKQENCSSERQLIQQPVIQPIVEKYEEPDYLTVAQKKMLKEKEKQQLKRKKEKEKKAALRDKEKRRKTQMKAKNEAKKNAAKAKAAAAKEKAAARKK